MPETKKLFSLFCTVFAILYRFDTEKTDKRKQLASPNASKNNYFWNHLEVLLFSLICLFSVKTVQNSENSQYPNASKCFQIAKTVQNSENSFLVSGTLSYKFQVLAANVPPLDRKSDRGCTANNLLETGSIHGAKSPLAFIICSTTSQRRPLSLNLNADV